MTTGSASNSANFSVGLPVGIGFVALALLVGGVGLWSVTANLAGAVIIRGEIAIEAGVQAVQHPEGGVVSDLQVRNGDQVQAGQVLLRLDDTFLQSERSLIQRQLSELSSRMARLRAERDGSKAVRFSKELERLAANDAAVQEVLDRQQNLFGARTQLLSQQSDQLVEKRRQKHLEIRGARAQLKALRAQRTLMTEEISNLQRLFEKGLAPSARILAMQRELVRTEGEVGRLEAAIARFRGQVVSIEIELSRLVTQSGERTLSELADLTLRHSEVSEQQLKIDQKISRMTVRAPVSGIIHKSQVSATRSIVEPTRPMMYVIPQDRPLFVVGRIAPVRVDQVIPGQMASLRFTALDGRSTPELAGVVTTVSADVFIDDVTGAPYYRVEIQPASGETSRLNAYRILPGMPVEVLISTGERNAFSYIVKPVSDYLARAWRA